MPSSRNRAQNSGDSRNPDRESSRGEPSWGGVITVEQVIQLVASIVVTSVSPMRENSYRTRITTHTEEVRKLQEEVQRLKYSQSVSPPTPDHSIPFSDGRVVQQSNHRISSFPAFGNMMAPEISEDTSPVSRMLLTTSIMCFQDFSKIFLHQFSSSKKYPMTTLNLFNVRQKEREILWDYICCFNETIIEVPSATPNLLIGAFTQGLQRGISSGGSTDGNSNKARKSGRCHMENMQVVAVRYRRGPIISFGPDDLPTDTKTHNDALVIRAVVADYDVSRVKLNKCFIQWSYGAKGFEDYPVKPVKTPVSDLLGIP
ncbi:hypothetical protein F511_41262 [Dorcoceras hygrometricum]|uniref:Retrotransposon gag domain-containing protein n=1 Tax=Dorcoceras hygrometricum TaxID=472368 RepID=A0A2Z7BVU9_9LAMI|nr:hypothetical protein F511_41262 [Dorcoceras hygrometricum]